MHNSKLHEGDIRRLLCLSLVTLAATLLPACGGGGGGGDDPEPDFTLRILSRGATEDGFVSAMRIIDDADTIMVGDGEIDPSSPGGLVGDNPYYGYARFRFEDITPEDGTITRSTIGLTLRNSRGLPMTELGTIKFVRISGSTPLTQAGILSAPALTYDPASDIDTLPAPGADFRADVTEIVRAARAAGEDVFIRFAFELPTNHDRRFDYIEVDSHEVDPFQGPRLRVYIDP